MSTAQKQARRNEQIQIRTSQVRVIGANGEQLGIFSVTEAIKLAQDDGLDLVEISPNADPPVCRIIDYGKYLFELTKKKAKKPKRVDVKELKFRPVIGENDYQVKFTNLLRFLEEGHKVKLTLRFRGREISHQELGIKLMDRLKRDLADVATIEQEPKFEGKQIVMSVAPLRKTAA